MATIGSTIDVQGIVSQLMQIERRPRTQITKQVAGIETKISAFGKLQSAVSSFQSAVQALGIGSKGNATWSAARASVSDDTMIGASAKAGAVAGAYSVDVLSLAQRQAVASTAFTSSSATVGGGTLTISLGSMADGSFSPDSSRTPVSIDVAAGASLADVRDAINKAKAGVSATLVADGTGQRLMLRGDATGASQAFSVSVSNAPADSQLGSLAFDPVNTDAADGRLQLTQSAADAVLKVNGLQVSSPTNSVTGVIENVTLDLKRTTTSSVNVNVTSDIGSMRSKIDGFVKAYNDLTKLVNEQTKYDEGSKTAGVLQGNSAPLRLQSQLRTMLRSPGGGTAEGDFANLNAMGIELQRDGTLSVNDTRMSAALASPEKIKRFFSGTGEGETASPGFAKKMDTLVGSMLGSDGLFASITNGLTASKTAANKRLDSFDRKMDDVQERLMKQYSNLDVNLQRISASYSSVQGLVNSLY